MNINITELQNNLDVVFNDKFYDSILAAARIFFGNHAVEADVKNYRLYIKKNINLTLIFSGNESKVYINTYIAKEVDVDAYITLHKENSSFRLFDIKQVVEYLQMKWWEDVFIRQNGE